MKIVSNILLVAFFCLAIFSCKKENNTEAPNLGYTYFPVDVGHYIIYDVDSAQKSDWDHLETHSQYQIKEVIESVFTDNQGRPTLRIERYRKDSLFYPDWTIYNVWSANLTATTAERFENNIRYIKLIFPIQNGKTWNGNSMNTDEGEDYQYTGSHEHMTINNLTFDSVSTVLQVDDLSNFVTPKYKEEKYAAGVGLIYRKKMEFHTQLDSVGKPDTLSYIIYTERIVDFGN
ncbi:MAG: hypothetical protein ABI723_25005 [Bacteroidia bacterium]